MHHIIMYVLINLNHIILYIYISPVKINVQVSEKLLPNPLYRPARFENFVGILEVSVDLFRQSWWNKLH